MVSALRVALQGSIRPAQARGPSIPRAPRRADMQVQAALEHRAHGLALAHDPASARLVQAAHRAPAAPRRQRAKRHVRSVRLQEAAAGARSIPKRRKAR